MQFEEKGTLLRVKNTQRDSNKVASLVNFVFKWRTFFFLRCLHRRLPPVPIDVENNFCG